MQKFTIVAGDVELDTYDDFKISLNYQMEEVFDITKRKTNYSKTIEIPGTKTNNDFFHHLYDVNITTLYFNPSVMGRDIVVSVGDSIVLTGNIQLLNIKNIQGEIIYEVSIFGNLRTILNDISDYTLNQLGTQLEKYNHIRDIDTVAKSWEYKIYEYDNLVTHAGGGNGYVYPHIINDFNTTDNANVMILGKQFPAVYVKTIIDAIFESTGGGEGLYSYTSNFFNSEYFSKLIMPFTGDKLELTPDDVNKRTTTIGVDGDKVETPGSIPTGFRGLVSSYLYGGNGWYSNSNYYYAFPLNRESGQLNDREYQDNQNQWGEYNGWDCKQNGWYDFDMDLKMFPKYFSDNGLDFRYNGNHTWKYYYRVIKRKAGGGDTILYDSLAANNGSPSEVGPSDDQFHSQPWYDMATELTLGANINNVYMEVGDRFLVQFNVNYNLDSSQWRVKSGSNKVHLLPVIKESHGGAESYLEVKPSSSTSDGNELINLANTLPNIKMKDFFLNIVKMFDLVVVDNPQLPNNLIIEPRKDYFKSKPRVIDWTHLVDRSDEIILSPMAEVDARTYTLTYRADDDFYNKQYTEAHKEIYGENKFDIQNDFSYEENKLELIFSPTPDAQQFIEPRVAPYFADMSEVGVFKSKKVKPRILFYNGLIPINYHGENLTDAESSIILKEYYSQPNSAGVKSYGYPYVGMYDHPFQPIYDLGFGRTKELYWGTNKVPYNNLYEMFHKHTIESIIHPDAMIMEAWLYLTPKDLAEFDFRNSYFIDGQYWRVMKIKDYNPVGSDELTNVIFYKITNFETVVFGADGGNESVGTGVRKCPTDIVAVSGLASGNKGTSKDWYYVSNSGKYLGAECCKAIGGTTWTADGRCKVKRVIGPVVGTVVGTVKPKPVTGLVGGVRPVTGGSGVLPVISTKGPAVLADRYNSIHSFNTSVNGKGNYVGSNVSNATIVGDNNSVVAGVSNVLVVGDGISATESGAIYLDDIKISKDGAITRTSMYIIDGGENEVLRVTKRNDTTIIDGTIDDVRNPNGDKSNRVILDANKNDLLNLIS